MRLTNAPLEVQCLVLSWLNLRDLATVARTCTIWRDVFLKNSTLWKLLLQRYFPEHETLLWAHPQLKLVNHKRIFLRYAALNNRLHCAKHNPICLPIWNLDSTNHSYTNNRVYNIFKHTDLLIAHDIFGNAHNHIISAYDDGACIFWKQDAKNGCSWETNIKINSGICNSMAILQQPHGTKADRHVNLLTGGNQGQIKWWKIQEKVLPKEPHQILSVDDRSKYHHSGNVIDIAPLAGGELIISTCHNTVNLWKKNRRKQYRCFLQFSNALDAHIEAATVCGDRMYVCHEEVEEWDVETGTVVQTMISQSSSQSGNNYTQIQRHNNIVAVSGLNGVSLLCARSGKLIFCDPAAVESFHIDTNHLISCGGYPAKAVKTFSLRNLRSYQTSKPMICFRSKFDLNSVPWKVKYDGGKLVVGSFGQPTIFDFAGPV
eukprot:TRINITY_DN22214_c0_g1_i1.p1 TRINITY_DN22214_c0_g1~~TRINITY_DN22214_c0_g1_i1.p1  ORF type:complete len:431 (-),score=45.23 TRINITY_DN22214_c0_g1_i1:9-1301(-)